MQHPLILNISSTTKSTVTKTTRKSTRATTRKNARKVTTRMDSDAARTGTIQVPDLPVDNQPLPVHPARPLDQPLSLSRDQLPKRKAAENHLLNQLKIVEEETEDEDSIDMEEDFYEDFYEAEEVLDREEDGPGPLSGVSDVNSMSAIQSEAADEPIAHAKVKGKRGRQAAQPKARKRTTRQRGKEPESDHDGESDTGSNLSGGKRLGRFMWCLQANSTSCITDPLIFEYEVIIHNEQQGMRERKSFDSFSSWPTIQDRLAEVFGIHPTQLSAQYRFSTDKKGDLPYNLRGQADLDSLVKHLQASLPQGRKRGRSPKMPIVEIFNKMNGIVTTTTTVRHLYKIVVSILML